MQVWQGQTELGKPAVKLFTVVSNGNDGGSSSDSSGDGGSSSGSDGDVGESSNIRIKVRFSTILWLKILWEFTNKP